MSEGRRPWLRRLLVVPPVLVGVGILAWQIAGREAPEKAPASEIARPVRVIAVEPTTYVPRATGFGHVEPGTVWNAVAEVSGRVVERHVDLEPGKLFGAGTAILRIDPADYELAVSRIEATLDGIEAELAQLDVEEANTRASVEIERRALALATDDLGRKRTLLRQGNVSQAAVDEAERAVLTQRQRVQELENALNLLPARRAVLEAEQALEEAQLEEAELDLARTVIRVPFDARVAEVEVEEGQFVAVGEVLAVADSLDVAEVAAQVPVPQMSVLFRGDKGFATVGAEEFGVVLDRFGLDAVVRFAFGDAEVRWQARVDRISPQIDPETRTVGVVVAVDQPYRQAVPGRRPPLVKNMYVRVEVFGEPRTGVFVVPRVALHPEAGQSVVYVADAEDRLVRRPVETSVVQGDLAVLAAGLAAGERVVVTDLIPAIDGMLLAPTEDADLAAGIAATAGRPPR